MAKPHHHLRVFVAYTSELEPERLAVTDVAQQLNRSLAASMEVYLEVTDWKSGAVTDAGRPEGVILDQLPVSTWDVFIGMLGTRFGTPTGAIKRDGTPYLSGTEEEFQLAYDSWLERQQPRILLFRCVRSADPRQLDPDQYARVCAFFERCSADGPNPALVTNFDSIDKLKEELFSALTQLILLHRDQRDRSAVLPPGAGADFLTSLGEMGFCGFYTPPANEVRNSRKRAALAAERRLVRLLAHVGHSYLARVGKKFGDELQTAIESGARVCVALMNPWTETGLWIAIGEAGERQGRAFLQAYRSDRSSVNPVDFIQESAYYKYSLLQVIDEYRHWRVEHGDRIDLRFTTLDIPATILLTSDQGFFEPYITVDLQQRLRKALHTFEVHFGRKCYLYDHASSYFDTLWDNTLPCEQFLQLEDEFRDRLRAILGVPQSI